MFVVCLCVYRKSDLLIVSLWRRNSSLSSRERWWTLMKLPWNRHRCSTGLMVSAATGSTRPLTSPSETAALSLSLRQYSSVRPVERLSALPMDKSVIKFNHCDKDIFCFFVPDQCPECGVSFSGKRLEEAPVSIPNPFSNGHKVPCAFLVASTEDSVLRYDIHIISWRFLRLSSCWESFEQFLDWCCASYRNFDGRSDLHTGITNTNGTAF